MQNISVVLVLLKVAIGLDDKVRGSIEHRIEIELESKILNVDNYSSPHSILAPLEFQHVRFILA